MENYLLDTEYMYQWRKSSVFGRSEDAGCRKHPTRLSSAYVKAMISNDTRHLERVEQHLEFLSSTQPTRGRSRSIHPDDPQSERDASLRQEGER
jgi:hypothetical protein